MRLIDADALVDTLSVDPIGCAGCPEPEFMDELIDILDTAPTVEPTGDLISRADALAYPIRIDHYDREHGNLHFVLGIESVMEYIEALPSAEAVQGEWVRKYDDKINCYWYECDQCGEYRPRNQFGHEYNSNFCPNCGAKIVKGGDTE